MFLLRAIVFVVCFYAQLTLAAPTDGESVRKFLHDVLAAMNEPAARRTPTLRLAFSNNPQAVNTMINRTDHENVLREAGIEKYGVINGDHLRYAEISTDIVRKVRQVVGYNTNLNSETIRRASTVVITDNSTQYFYERMNLGIESIRFSEQKVMQSLFDPVHGIQLTDPNLETLIRSELPKYYDNLPVHEKRRIAQGILALPPTADHYAHLEAILQETGPFVQKMFQLLTDSVSSQQLANIFARIQSQIKPFPFEKIRPVIEARLGPIDAAFANFNRDALASGTIGQIHVATTHEGENVVVKVRRPEVYERLQTDYQTLKRVIQEPGLLELIEKIYHTIMTEIDFNNEAKFLRQGEMYIDRKKGVTIAKLNRKFRVSEDVLVVNRAIGDPMTSIAQDNTETLQLKAKALANLADVWFRKAVYESGFFHGDLHGGNLFFKPDPDSRTGYMLTIIDFGNSHQLTARQQRGFVKLTVACLLGTEYAAAHAIRDMLGLQPESMPQIEAVVARSFEEARSVSERLTMTVINLEQSKFPLPESFVSFARARLFIESALDKINGEIKNRGGKSQYNTLKVFAWSTLKQMFTKLPWNQQVLSFSVFGDIIHSNCRSLKDNLHLQVPDRLWFKNAH